LQAAAKMMSAGGCSLLQAPHSLLCSSAPLQDIAQQQQQGPEDEEPTPSTSSDSRPCPPRPTSSPCAPASSTLSSISNSCPCPPRSSSTLCAQPPSAQPVSTSDSRICYSLSAEYSPSPLTPDLAGLEQGKLPTKGSTSEAAGAGMCGAGRSSLAE